MDPVLAYLDPGSWSIVAQAVIAGIIAVPVIFKNRILRITRAVRGSAFPRPDRETIAEPTPRDHTAP